VTDDAGRDPGLRAGPDGADGRGDPEVRVGLVPDELVDVMTDRWTAPYWEALAEGRFVVPRCEACGTLRFPPTPFCPSCRSDRLGWLEVAPRGRIYTFTVIRHAVIPEVAAALPIVVALVEPDEAPGCRIVGNVADADPEQVHVGAEVEMAARRVRDGVAVPCFRLR